MHRIEVSVKIRRPKKQVYELIKDMESFPMFIRDIKSLKIIKRIDHGIITAWSKEVDGALVNWKEEDYFDGKNYQVKFFILEGNYKEYQSHWSAQDYHRGTNLSLTVNFDWGIPILEKYVGKTLEKKTRGGLLLNLAFLKDILTTDERR